MKITRRDFIKDVLAKGSVIPAVKMLEVLPSGSNYFGESSLKEAMFYKKLNGVMIQCLLEPRSCVVNDFERGYCGAKENRGGRYYSLVYAKPSAVYVENIESDHFYHVLPKSQFLGIGTAGCNLGCKFCETWHISQVRPEDTDTEDLSPEDAVKRALENNCRILCFTYNEPVICYEYVLETAKLAKKAGLVVLCHSAGHIFDEPLKLLLENIDGINIDLKAFSKEYYNTICGVDVEQTLKALKVIRQTRVVLEITNLIVPQHNDDPKELSDMCSWIYDNLGDDVPLHFSRFFPNYQMADLTATPIETLEMACEIAKTKGLKYVYMDNVDGGKYMSTYCPSCNTILIQRDRNNVSILNIGDDGTCQKCGHHIPGIWH